MENMELLRELEKKGEYGIKRSLQKNGGIQKEK